jgi:hypothetical protein
MTASTRANPAVVECLTHAARMVIQSKYVGWYPVHQHRDFLGVSGVRRVKVSRDAAR